MFFFNSLSHLFVPGWFNYSIYSPQSGSPLYFSKGDYIIMVENVNVTSYNVQKLRHLIENTFQNREQLTITLSKASKPSTELEVEFRNFSEMEELGLNLAMVFRKKSTETGECAVIKDYDVIEKVRYHYKNESNFLSRCTSIICRNFCFIITSDIFF